MDGRNITTVTRLFVERLGQYNFSKPWIIPVLWPVLRKVWPSHGAIMNTIAMFSIIPGLILVLHPANERRRYKVTPSPIGWAQT